MKRILLGILTLLTIGGVSAQERQDRIDSIYYNRSGKSAANPVFAEYLRIALYPADSTARKEYKDFYLTGELRSEGYFSSVSIRWTTAEPSSTAKTIAITRAGRPSRKSTMQTDNSTAVTSNSTKAEN